MCGPEIRFGVSNRAEIFTRNINHQKHWLLKISDRKDQPKWKIISDGEEPLIYHQFFKFRIEFFLLFYIPFYSLWKIVHRMVYNSWDFILFMAKYIFTKIRIDHFLTSKFEPDWDIRKTILSQSDDSSKSYRLNGWLDTLIDF